MFYCSGPSATRFRLLKHTRLNVVAFLNELPKTQHDIASFNVDVNTYTVREFYCATVSLRLKSFRIRLICFSLFSQSSLLSFTVSGVFKEGMDMIDLNSFSNEFKPLQYHR